MKLPEWQAEDDDLFFMPALSSIPARLSGVKSLNPKRGNITEMLP